MKKTDVTINQRIRFWKMVRRILVNRIVNKAYVGIYCTPALCDAINTAGENILAGHGRDMKNVRRVLRDYVTHYFFDEHLKHEPKERWTGNTNYWWNPKTEEGQRKRVAVCDKVIASLEKKR